MNKKEYVEKTRQLVLPIADKLDLEIVDIEYVKEGDNNYLRVYIEKESGVDINDCENLSRALSDELDSKDFIEDEYILEVSSPGDHPFKCDRDYERNLNKYVFVKTYNSIDGKKVFNGDIIKVDETSITLLTDDGEILINKDKIARANVDFKL